MPYTREKRIEIANTIISQLGGNKFKVMTGAKDIFALESGVSFKVPATMTKNRINYIRVWLNSMDLYDVEFWSYRGMSGRKVAEHNGIYDDMLQDIFTTETGLNTSL